MANVVNEFVKIIGTYDGDHRFAHHHRGRTRWDGDPARGPFITPKMEKRKKRAHSK